MASKIYGIKDSANLYINYKSGKKAGKNFLYADYATVVTNDWTSEQVYARSKNVNAIRWDYNKASTLKVDCEIFDLALLELVSGSEFAKQATDIFVREVLPVSGGKATMTGEAVAGSVLVYTLEDDLTTNSGELTLGEAAGEGKYVISGKEITVDASLNDTSIAVFYRKAVAEARVLTIAADKFPANFEVIADTCLRSTSGEDEFVQITYLNCKPKSQFTLTMDANNITTLSVEFDLLKDVASSDMAVYKLI